jgi:DNA repair protein RecO (recombination protein O)
MQMKTDGLIIRDLNVGEDDRIVTILTREKGIVRASARGARRVNSRLSTATRLFCYSNFTMFKGREKYIINDAEPLEFFLGVNKDLEKLALSQYFAQLCGFLTPEEEPAELFLRLMLNALHFIESDTRPLQLLKPAFELRLLTMSGYMPDIVACRSCGAYEADMMYLEPLSGSLLCDNCVGQGEEASVRMRLSKGELAAMRHTIYADFEKLFSFSLPQPALRELAQASQAYLLCRIERSFPTLEFYNGLIGEK